MKKNFRKQRWHHIWWKVRFWRKVERGGLTHILVAVCNASRLRCRENLHSFSFSSNWREKDKSIMEENDWQAKKHVENKCENGRYGASPTKLICYASLVFTFVYTSFKCLGLSIRPYLYSLWFIALVSLLPERLIQLWNPTGISRSIVTKCHSPITILFHWAGLGLYNFYHMQSSITVIFNCNHMPPSDQNSVPLGWTWFVQ